MGFAIPINMAKDILQDLMRGREIQRGFLGIVGEDLTPEVAKQLPYSGRGGALVNEVLPDSPAEKAGLKPGDIIIEWNGRSVEDFSRLSRLVAETKPGTTVRLRVWRGKKELSLTARVETQKAEGPMRGDWLGLRVQDVTDQIQRAMQRPDLKGVLVTGMHADSPAAEVIAPGDVIIGINQTPVSSLKQYRQLVGAIPPAQGVLLRYVDGQTGRIRFVAVPGAQP